MCFLNKKKKLLFDLDCQLLQNIVIIWQLLSKYELQIVFYSKIGNSLMVESEKLFTFLNRIGFGYIRGLNFVLELLSVFSMFRSLGNIPCLESSTIYTFFFGRWDYGLLLCHAYLRHDVWRNRQSCKNETKFDWV